MFNIGNYSLGCQKVYHFLLLLVFLILFHVFECFVRMGIRALHVCLNPMEEEVSRSPGTEVTDVCEPPCGFWERNLGHGRSGALRAVSESSF